MSSTAAPNTPPPPTSTNTDDDENRSILTSGGFPLILTFIVVGLFIGGLLVCFSVRRYTVSNRRRIRAFDEARAWRIWNRDVMTMNLEGQLGAQPELWTIQAVQAHSMEWACIQVRPTVLKYSECCRSIQTYPTTTPLFQPIAAKRIYDDAATSFPSPASRSMLQLAHNYQNAPFSSSSSEQGPFYPFQVGLRDFAVQVHAIRPSQGSSPHHPPHPLSPQAPGPPTANAGASSGVATPLAGVGGPTHMQIALAIAFPTQEPYVTDIPMHALGITEVRWRGGTLEN